MSGFFHATLLEGGKPFILITVFEKIIDTKLNDNLLQKSKTGK
jgi:hypothetical protein